MKCISICLHTSFTSQTEETSANTTMLIMQGITIQTEETSATTMSFEDELTTYSYSTKNDISNSDFEDKIDIAKKQVLFVKSLGYGYVVTLKLTYFLKYVSFHCKCQPQLSIYYVINLLCISSSFNSWLPIKLHCYVSVTVNDYGSSQFKLHFYKCVVFCSPLRHWRNGSSS